MMALILALEASSILAVVGGAVLILTRPVLAGWIDVLTLLAETAGLTLAFLAAFSYAGFYNPRVIRSFDGFLQGVPRALVGAGLLVALVCSLVPAARITGDVLTSCVLITIGVVFGPFLPVRAVVHRLIRSRRFVEHLLIVGTSPLARQLVQEMDSRPDCRYVVAGMVDEGTDGDARTPDGGIGSLESLDRIIDQVRPDRIVVALADRRGRLPVQRLLEAWVHRGIHVEDGVRLYERLTGKLAIETLTPSQMIFGEGFRQSRLAMIVRRGLSALVAAVGLAVTVPLVGLIALAIRLDSRGPVFFAQRRVGFRGKPFTLLKFRTMHPVEKPSSEWARDNGHRITRVGRWLRRFWLDELPQLVNVFRGDMNLVGPRPHPASNFELLVLVSRNAPECGEPIPYYALRCMVRPGLTGWAQVRYRYANDLDEEIEKLRYDLYYIKHLSIWLDFRIIFETLKMMLGGRSLAAPDVHQVELPEPVPSRWQIPAWLPVDRDGSAQAGAGVHVGQLDLRLTGEPSPTVTAEDVR